MAGKRRQFGRVRKLPSGRYQARYRGPDGVDRPAPHTFRTKRDADDWLADRQSELRQGDWRDPDAGKVPFGAYAGAWVRERPLAPRTAELYASLLRLHLVPTFGAMAVADITPAAVRTWRRARLDAGIGPSTVAKAYALLRTIMGTAVEDDLIRRNPCQIRNGGNVVTPERPTASIPEVFAIAEKIQPRYKALVLLAGFCGLRWGELIALHRSDVDLEHGMIRVRGAVSELTNGQRVYKAPKSAAGKRLVAVPPSILPFVKSHMTVYAEGGAGGRVFVGAKKATPRRNHFNRLWHKACADAGVEGLRFHDLRHTGNTLASRTNASTKELMARLGHSTARAALIYQHADFDREREIAGAVDGMIRKALDQQRSRNGHAEGTRD
ncbi:site-specific integrase [Streptomyces sp. Vc74B-19]|uniref:tyrosine-type recombinase/integrase n=1 Tax=Streptomyces sp. Vc74B-19 TaxID=2741324 RepID=UPI001BFCC069|nr:tyrosine-type recombinase/integrase [Streptomyces sp. Vc74B-19]MBT3165692.1 site-specific integrase [Streptomyces sp. Vc74B-19]